MAWTLVKADGTSEQDVDLKHVKKELASGEHFWLDIGHPSDEEVIVAAGVVAYVRVRRWI